MSLRVIQGGGFRQRKKATKIDRLKTEVSILKMANKELIDRLKFLLKVMKDLEKESNWCVGGMAKPEDEAIIWVGEGDPPTIIGAALARIRGAAQKFDEKVDVVKEGDVPDGGPAAPDKVPFVVYGPDSMPAGGMVVAPSKPKD